ncbi:hypothetical protein Csa_017765, partial [Cucumis sativus]
HRLSSIVDRSLGEIRDLHSGGRTNVHRSLGMVEDSGTDESELGRGGWAIRRLGVVAWRMAVYSFQGR